MQLWGIMHYSRCGAGVNRSRCGYVILRFWDCFWVGQYDSWVSPHLLNTVYLNRKFFKCIGHVRSMHCLASKWYIKISTVFKWWSHAVCISSHIWGIPGCFVKTAVCVCISVWSEPNLIITVISPQCEISIVFTLGMTELYCH